MASKTTKEFKIKLRLKKNKACTNIMKQVSNIEDQLGKEAENNLSEVKRMCKEFGDSMGSMNMVVSGSILRN